MAIKPITPRDYAPDPCGECPTVYFGTASVSGPLYLVGTFTTFRTEPAYKRIRGVPVLCGAKLRLWDTFCIREQPGGNGLDHIFQLPCADNGATLWYVISDQCRSDLATGFTHVIRYVYDGCEDPIRFCQIERDTNVSVISTSANIPFQVVTAGNPTLWNPFTTIDVEGGIPLRAYSIGKLRRTGIAGTTSYTMDLRLTSPLRVLSSVTFSLGPNETFDWLLNALTLPDQDNTLACHITVNSGWQGYQLLGAVHTLKLSMSQL